MEKGLFQIGGKWRIALLVLAWPLLLWLAMRGLPHGGGAAEALTISAGPLTGLWLAAIGGRLLEFLPVLAALAVLFGLLAAFYRRSQNILVAIFTEGLWLSIGMAFTMARTAA